MRNLLWLILLLSTPSFAFLTGGGSGLPTCTDGQVPAWAAGSFSSCIDPAGGGTVTSVGMATDSTTDSIFANSTHVVTGSPVTASGGFTLTLSSQTQNKFLGSPNGSSGAPSFRALVAADVPTLNQNTTGTAADLSVALSIAHGGTGQTSAGLAFNALSPMSAVGDVIYGGTSGAGTRLAGDTSDTRKFLRSLSSSGVATAPVWDTLLAADVPTLNQNTTGTAATLSATLALNKGGTGQTTKAAAYDALSPLSTLGDLPYGGASGTGTRLAGNTTATKKFLTQTGDSVNSAAPAWGTIAAGDVPTLNQNTSGTAAGLSATLAVGSGGTNSAAALNSNRFMISSGGAIVEASAVTASRAVVSDSNGLPTASSVTSAALANAILRDKSGLILAPTAFTYPVDHYWPTAATITGLWCELTSGTLTAAVKINGTNVTSLSAVSCSSTGAFTAATGANTLAAHDTVDLVTSSISSPVTFNWAVWYTVN